MFVPTTIFDMVWGVRFLEEAHDVPYSMAVLRSASVPFGWIIGCPLLGWLSDRIGRRKPVIIGAGVVLLGLHGPRSSTDPPAVFPPFSLGLIAGIASGAAMLPYTVIKEANRPEHSGTATGRDQLHQLLVLRPAGPGLRRLLMRASGGGERELAHYQATFQPLLYGVGAGGPARPCSCARTARRPHAAAPPPRLASLPPRMRPAQELAMSDSSR